MVSHRQLVSQTVLGSLSLIGRGIRYWYVSQILPPGYVHGRAMPKYLALIKVNYLSPLYCSEIG